MSTLGNLLWIFLGGGIFLFFEYLFGGLILCITIVGIPFGLQCIKLSILGLVPFGKEIVTTESASGCLSIFMNSRRHMDIPDSSDFCIIINDHNNRDTIRQTAY